MRRLHSVLAIGLLWGLGACVDDTTAPLDQTGQSLQVSLVAPQRVSAEETNVLAGAFDQVDEYSVVIMDALTLETLADTVIGITSGGATHSLNVAVPDNAFGRSVTIDLIAFSANLELYRSTQTLILQEGLGQLPLPLEIRYTGPGVRGQVVDESGTGLGGISVLLTDDEGSDTTILTEEDGTYLFVGVQVNRAWRVIPTPPQGFFMCPAARDVRLGSSDDAVVADFRAETNSCGVQVLVLSGGDFDDTPEVVTLLQGDPALTVSNFFYVNQLPSADLLNQHDVVLLFANGLFDASSALGTLIRDYVNIGGNVVTTSFYWQNRLDSGLGSTGWGSLELVDAMTSAGGANYSPTGDLGSVVPHPLTTGLNTLTSSSFWGGTSARTGEGARVVATWANGSPLVAYRTLAGGQRMVGVSLFPAIGLEATGDVAVLFQNAANWAGAAGGPAQN